MENGVSHCNNSFVKIDAHMLEYLKFLVHSMIFWVSSSDVQVCFTSLPRCHFLTGGKGKTRDKGPSLIHA